jgi:CRISPR-associated endoribonuclease Cas6
MRLLFRLQADFDQKDTSLEYHKLQGFVYTLINSCGFPLIHDKKGYKPFCFSNIFPYGDMSAGDLRTFIIASPSASIVQGLAKYLSASGNTPIHIGDCSFSLNSVDVRATALRSLSVRLTCGTPIILRIPERNYDRYEIPEEERRPRYIYWRPQISFEAFIKQLTENLIKKYNQFYGTEIETVPLFQEFLFRKMVHTRLIIDGKSYGVAGSMWEFHWSHMNHLQQQVIEFGMDAGFGERNSMGFGFVNVGRGG